MSKKLLVLAASSEQIETIKKAKQLGCQVVTLDNRPANPGHRIADKCYAVDTTDMDGVLAVARREAIDGVISPCTDVAVPTAAYVAQAMHLKGPPLETCRIVCDKIRFREFLHQRGFPLPRHIALDSRSDVDEALFYEGPWIIKPDRSSGSKGVFIVRSRAEFRQRLAETLRFSPAGHAILERFIDGFQGTCEAVLQNGSIRLSFLLDRQTAPAPHVTTSGHMVPSLLSPDLQSMVQTELAKLWKHLEYSDGAFDCDFVATDKEIYLLEVSPRMGGNSISSLIRESTGFDLVAYSIRQALNQDYPIPTGLSAKPAAVVILGTLQAGRLWYNRAEAEALAKESWVRLLHFDVDWGDLVYPFVNSRHRIGQAIVTGESRDDVEARVAALKRRLGIRAIEAQLEL